MSTILVVDDRPDARYVTARTLSAAGYAVNETATGRGALRLASRHPDLIILDVVLPDIDGFEVCRRLKSDRLTHAIPVVHKTALRCDEADRDLGFAVGADGYLVDPVRPDTLLDTVQRLLQRTASAEMLIGLLSTLPVCTGCLADRSGFDATAVEAAIGTTAATVQLLVGPHVCVRCLQARTTVRLPGAEPAAVTGPPPATRAAEPRNPAPRRIPRQALDAETLWGFLEVRRGEMFCTACVASAIGATQRVDRVVIAAEGRGALRRHGRCAACGKDRLLCGLAT